MAKGNWTTDEVVDLKYHNITDLNKLLNDLFNIKGRTEAYSNVRIGGLSDLISEYYSFKPCVYYNKPGYSRGEYYIFSDVTFDDFLIMLKYSKATLDELVAKATETSPIRNDWKDKIELLLEN